MHFSTLGTIPNITSGTNTVLTSSFVLDSSGYPHIAWIEEKQGHNEINYKFWNGLTWSYYNIPYIYNINNEYTTKYSLILNNDSPVIIFITKLKDYYALNIVNLVDGEFVISTEELTHNINWVGITNFYNEWISSSSSSSHASKNYIACNDDNIIYIYSYDGNFNLISQINETVSNSSSLRLYGLVNKICLVYSTSTEIKYNYYDYFTDTWFMPYFQTLTNSILSEEIIDLDIDSYYGSGYLETCIGWVSYDSNIKIRHTYVDTSGNERTSGATSLIKTDNSLTSISDTYTNGGWKTIGVTTNDGLSKIITCGSKNNLFYNQYGFWEEHTTYFDPINIEQIKPIEDSKMKVTLTCPQGVYYYEENSESDDAVYPELYLLTKERLNKSEWKIGELDITTISGCNYDNELGCILYDKINPMLVLTAEEDPNCNTTSSSSSSSKSTSSSSSLNHSFSSNSEST